MTNQQEDHLPHYKVRPRFKVETPYSSEEIEQKISERLVDENATCKGKTNPKFIALYLPLKEQHYWSPQLRLTIENNESGSILRGLYGPRPSVWTLFVFCYSLIGFITFVIAVIGLSKLSLDGSAPILWLVPVLILIISSLYLIAYLGQKAGHDQMVTLHQFLEDSIGMSIVED